MICDLHEVSAVRPTAEARAQLMGLRSSARVLTTAVLGADDMDRANLYRQAIKVVAYDIAQLEAA